MSNEIPKQPFTVVTSPAAQTAVNAQLPFLGRLNVQNYAVSAYAFDGKDVSFEMEIDLPTGWMMTKTGSIVTLYRDSAAVDDIPRDVFSRARCTILDQGLEVVTPQLDIKPFSNMPVPLSGLAGAFIDASEPFIDPSGPAKPYFTSYLTTTNGMYTRVGAGDWTFQLAGPQLVAAVDDDTCIVSIDNGTQTLLATKKSTDLTSTTFYTIEKSAFNLESMHSLPGNNVAYVMFDIANSRYVIGVSTYDANNTALLQPNFTPSSLFSTVSSGGVDSAYTVMINQSLMLVSTNGINLSFVKWSALTQATVASATENIVNVTNNIGKAFSTGPSAGTLFGVKPTGAIFQATINDSVSGNISAVESISAATASALLGTITYTADYVNFESAGGFLVVANNNVYATNSTMSAFMPFSATQPYPGTTVRLVTADAQSTCYVTGGSPEGVAMFSEAQLQSFYIVPTSTTVETVLPYQPNLTSNVNGVAVEGEVTMAFRGYATDPGVRNLACSTNGVGILKQLSTLIGWQQVSGTNSIDYVRTLLVGATSPDDVLRNTALITANAVDVGTNVSVTATFDDLVQLDVPLLSSSTEIIVDVSVVNDVTDLLYVLTYDSTTTNSRVLKYDPAQVAASRWSLLFSQAEVMDTIAATGIDEIVYMIGAPGSRRPGLYYQGTNTTPINWATYQSYDDNYLQAVGMSSAFLCARVPNTDGSNKNGMLLARFTNYNGTLRAVTNTYSANNEADAGVVYRPVQTANSLHTVGFYGNGRYLAGYPYGVMSTQATINTNNTVSLQGTDPSAAGRLRLYSQVAPSRQHWRSTTQLLATPVTYQTYMYAVINAEGTILGRMQFNNTWSSTVSPPDFEPWALLSPTTGGEKLYQVMSVNNNDTEFIGLMFTTQSQTYPQLVRLVLGTQTDPTTGLQLLQHESLLTAPTYTSTGVLLTNSVGQVYSHDQTSLCFYATSKTLSRTLVNEFVDPTPVPTPTPTPSPTEVSPTPTSSPSPVPSTSSNNNETALEAAVIVLAIISTAALIAIIVMLSLNMIVSPRSFSTQTDEE